MTKKADHAARVEANKRAAYLAKVQRLTGFAGGRITIEETNTAMDAGKEADAFAAEVAGRHPVGAAIFPLKVEAIEAATKAANEAIEKVRAALEAAGWNLDLVAPYPKSWGAAPDAYKRALARHNHFANITRSVSGSRRSGEPDIRVMDEKLCARRVRQWEEAAAFQYDTFICKLVSKIGQCDTAKLTGSHVWGFSVLTVTKGAVVELWKTQQIVNVSKLGLYFPQWPTRLLKGGA